MSDSNRTPLLRFAADKRLPTLTRSSPAPRGARLVHSMVPGTRIGRVLTTSSRDNHIPSLSEMLLLACSRGRIPTTTSWCAQESDSPQDLLEIENSVPTGRKSIVRRTLMSDTDRRKQLVHL